MGFKQNDVEKWIAQHAPGERLAGYTAASCQADPTFRIEVTDHSAIFAGGGHGPGGARRSEIVRELGFSGDSRVGPTYEVVFYALTDQQFLVGSRSSVRNRPKDLIHAAPRDQVNVHWFDDGERPTECRHFVIDFGDGHYRSDKTGLTVLGKTTDADALSTALLAELGDRATPH